MTEEQEKELKIIYNTNKSFKVNGEELNMDYDDYLYLTELVVQIFGVDIDKDSIDDCIGLIGAGILLGYRI